MPPLWSFMLPPLIFGPQPLFNNPFIDPDNFQPSQFFISAVSLGVTTTITTTTNLNYVVGQLVRLLIPYGFGCRQLNRRTGLVLSVPSPNQVIINIDSSQNVDPFKTNTLTTQPQIMAIGDINTGQVNANGPSVEAIFIPGSFVNIS